MKKNQKRAAFLLKKYVQGQIDDDEVIALNKLLISLPENELQTVFNMVWNSTDDHRNKQELFTLKEREKILHDILGPQQTSRTHNRLNLVKKWALPLAACVTLFLIGYMWLHKKQELPTGSEHRAMQQKGVDILPGSAKATFRTEGNKPIILDTGRPGVIERGEGYQIVRLDNGDIQYQLADTERPRQWHTVETPRGGQIHFVLPDGSKLWLNASSQVSFHPDMMHGNRLVKMKGEVYFEVTKKMDSHFIVQNDFGKIEVLGTKFNVDAYDADNVKAALITGSIQLSSAKQTIRMKPYELTTINKAGEMHVEYNEHIKDLISWTDGYFYFEGTDVKTVAEHLARWYDIDVITPMTQTNQKITGTIKRNVKLSKMIEMLNYLGLECTWKDNKLIIHTNKKS